MSTEAKEFRLPAAAAVAGVPVTTVKRLIDDNVLKLIAQSSGTWRTFSRVDVMRLSAIAEVKRVGLDPNRDRLVWYSLVDAMRAVDDDPALMKEGCFVVASCIPGRDDEEGTRWSPLVRPRAALSSLLGWSSEDIFGSHSWLVIDAVAVLARFNKRLDHATRGGE